MVRVHVCARVRASLYTCVSLIVGPWYTPCYYPPPTACRHAHPRDQHMLEALNSNSAGLADSIGKWQAKSRLMPCQDRPRPPAGRGRAPGASTGQIRMRAPPPHRAGLLAPNLVVDVLLGRRAKPSSIIHHALPLEAVSRRRVGLLPVSAALVPVPRG